MIRLIAWAAWKARASAAFIRARRARRRLIRAAELYANTAARRRTP